MKMLLKKYHKPDQVGNPVCEDKNSNQTDIEQVSYAQITNSGRPIVNPEIRSLVDVQTKASDVAKGAIPKRRTVRPTSDGIDANFADAGAVNSTDTSESGRIFRSRRRINAHIVSGTKVSADSKLNGAPRILDVFVGGCKTDSKAEDIMNYCKDSMGIIAKNCEQLVSKSVWSLSYKLSVEAADCDKLLFGEMWPKGIFVRKFYKSRASGLVGNLTNDQ